MLTYTYNKGGYMLKEDGFIIALHLKLADLLTIIGKTTPVGRG